MESPDPPYLSALVLLPDDTAGVAAEKLMGGGAVLGAGGSLGGPDAETLMEGTVCPLEKEGAGDAAGLLSFDVRRFIGVSSV